VSVSAMPSNVHPKYLDFGRDVRAWTTTLGGKFVSGACVRVLVQATDACASVQATEVCLPTTS